MLLSCKKTKEEYKQDVVEDLNDAMKPLDSLVKDIPERSSEKSEDKILEKESDKLRDSISRDSTKTNSNTNY